MPVTTHPSIPHALITGGSSGIGLALARQLAQQGYHIAIVARDPARLAAAQQLIANARQHAGQEVWTCAADVAVQPAISAAVTAAIDRLGPPTLLITAAGVAVPGYFQQQDLAIFEQTMQINYFGTLYTLRAALPAMMAHKRGQLVLISSGAGLIGIYGYSAYGPSKFAVRGLAETLRSELKPYGIRVAIAYPPDTETPQLAAEERSKPAATRRITGSARPWSADAVAQVILRGVQRGTFLITPGLEMYLLARLHSLLAPAIQWYIDRCVTAAPPPPDTHEPP